MACRMHDNAAMVTSATPDTWAARFDLFVIGGGINGAGIARDAAGRGLSVALCERGDFAGATSSASSKLIHGGLRYLEHYEFKLVAEALAERERLLKIAPHIAWPLRFVLPHSPEQRPAWMLRAGLMLYDNLHRLYGVTRTLQSSHSIANINQALNSKYYKGFEYSDAWVDDARLVILNLVDAKERGATIYPRTEFIASEESAQGFDITLMGSEGQVFKVHARAVVNAAGPWVKEAAQRDAQGSRAQVQLVKGSHIIVRRLMDEQRAYILQNEDKRVVFMLPYEQRFTLIGTTDLRIESSELPMKGQLRANAEETAYLCSAVNRYLVKPVAAAQVLHTYAGVRPLYDDDSANPSETTRDYVLKARHTAGGATWLDIYGGKITTYRYLAEEALAHLKPALPQMRGVWSASVALPGGDFGDYRQFAPLLQDAQQRYRYAPADWLRAALHRHGTRLHQWLGHAQTMSALGRDMGGGLYEAEAEYLRKQEWAMTEDDLMWRRTKCGLHAKLNDAH